MNLPEAQCYDRHAANIEAQSIEQIGRIETVTGQLGRSEDIQAKIKANDWNDYVIIAEGNRLQHFMS